LSVFVLSALEYQGTQEEQSSYFFKFHVVRTVHFGIKCYNDQRNAQVFNLFINLLLPDMFGLAFSPSSEAGVQLRQCFKSPGYGVSNRALTP
jgi:hypothetical protein